MQKKKDKNLMKTEERKVKSYGNFNSPSTLVKLRINSASNVSERSP